MPAPIISLKEPSMNNAIVTVNDKIAVKKDGGTIEQFSGATISPRAVAAGVKDSLTVINGMIGKCYCLCLLK